MPGKGQPQPPVIRREFSDPNPTLGNRNGTSKSVEESKVQAKSKKIDKAAEKKRQEEEKIARENHQKDVNKEKI